MKIAILNEKGGVGKTTTTATLGHALARLGKRVLVVDLDPQANLTAWLGRAPAPRASIANALVDHRAACDAIAPSTAAGVDLMYGSRATHEAADDLRASSPAPALALRRALRDLAYDVILLDCPPGVGTLSVNALCVADRVIVPIDSQAMALTGLQQVRQTIYELADAEVIQAQPTVWTLITRYDRRLALAGEVRDFLRDEVNGAHYAATIRLSTRLAECYGHAKTIFDYDLSAGVVGDYEMLAAEVIDEQ